MNVLSLFDGMSCGRKLENVPIYKIGQILI